MKLSGFKNDTTTKSTEKRTKQREKKSKPFFLKRESKREKEFTKKEREHKVEFIRWNNKRVLSVITERTHTYYYICINQSISFSQRVSLYVHFCFVCSLLLFLCETTNNNQQQYQVLFIAVLWKFVSREQYF